MCGACGGGGRAERSWEDAAGRLDTVGQRVRVRAVRRLLAGTRWKAEAWHGSWVVTGPTGQRHHAADLDALFALVPAPALPSRGPVMRAAAAPRQNWQLQAGLVWVAAARATGLTGTVQLPGDGGGGLRVQLGAEHHIEIGPAGDPARRLPVEVETAAADLVLASLLDVAAG